MSPEPRQPECPAVSSFESLAEVRQAWRAARRRTDPHAEGLARALHAFARDGRARGAPVAALLQALDGLVRRDDGEPGFERVREWAGTQVIRAYYRAD
jgi:hypothetical protein